VRAGTSLEIEAIRSGAYRCTQRKIVDASPVPAQRVQLMSPTVADLAAEKGRFRVEGEFRKLDHRRGEGKMKFTFVRPESKSKGMGEVLQLLGNHFPSIANAG
jgi:hypothetical protein